jgi:hypothetical protein
MDQNTKDAEPSKYTLQVTNTNIEKTGTTTGGLEDADVWGDVDDVSIQSSHSINSLLNQRRFLSL